VSRVSAASPVFAHAAGYNMRHGAIAVLLLATADRHAAAEVQKVSTNADGSTEEVNPYEASGDSTMECYTWAADGQCVSNPGYMHSSCKYSCFEWYAHRKRKYPDAPIDKSFHCVSWASSGECGKNADYMRKTCPEACKDKGYDAPQSAEPAKKKKKKKKKKSKAEA